MVIYKHNNIDNSNKCTCGYLVYKACFHTISVINLILNNIPMANNQGHAVV
jgi:hypothetical protein